LPVGSISYLNYGQRVIEVPQGMFALAVASAALPTLSRLHSEGKREELLELFRGSLRLTLFIALPASALLIALALPTTQVLLERGRFGLLQAQETAHNLALQAAGIAAVAAVRATVPMFAAHGDMRSPVKASSVNLVVFVLISVSLMGRIGHLAIALANSVAAFAQLAVLFVLLRRHTGPLGLGALFGSSLRIGALSALLGLVLHFVASWLDFGPAHGAITRVAMYGGLLALAAGLFLGGAYLLRAPELTSLRQAVARKRARRAL
jgi:putative peptidoglycan lipid II flippase